MERMLALSLSVVHSLIPDVPHDDDDVYSDKKKLE